MGTLRNLKKQEETEAAEDPRRQHLRDLVQRVKDHIAALGPEELHRQNMEIIKTSRRIEERLKQSKRVSPSVWNRPITI
jgi:hypothetical protein